MKYLLPLIIGFCTSYPSVGKAEGGVEALSPELRMLLQKEMAAIEKGMQEIIPAYVSGDLERVSEIAAQISGSYVLKQHLSEEQKHVLHEKLPADFIRRDQAFHKYAGRLEHASLQKNLELVAFYYSRMLESCVGFHTEHANHRFPELSVSDAENPHHH